jgi:hypothetical protein
MKLTVKNVNPEIRKVLAQSEEISKKGFEARVSRMVDDLKAATPVDTGRAQSGWSLVKKLRSIDVLNDVPYIQALNEGHSQQAPARFVERTAMKHGMPLGTIVRHS